LRAGCEDPRVQDGSLIARFARARRDPDVAVLEGLHALKHALRFGATILEVIAREPARLDRLAAELAPDVQAQVRALARPVDEQTFAQLAPLPPSTGVISLATRPRAQLREVLAAAGAAPLIVLEDPRDLGNVGACVRVAAAADAAGVLTVGGHDPWHPDALRGSAGLHFALPVLRLEDLQPLAETERALLAIDPAGEPLVPQLLPPRAVLAFGGERYGLSEQLTARASACLSIPMRDGVSSLNLATSVAAVLFGVRLSRAG
jgi:RNA methyltransferase, TrmH family